MTIMSEFEDFREEVLAVAKEREKIRIKKEIEGFDSLSLPFVEKEEYIVLKDFIHNIISEEQTDKSTESDFSIWQWTERIKEF